MKRRAAAAASDPVVVEKPEKSALEKDKSKERTPIFQRKLNSNFFNAEENKADEVEIKIPAKAPPQINRNEILKGSDDSYSSAKSGRKSKAQRNQEKEERAQLEQDYTRVKQDNKT